MAILHRIKAYLYEKLHAQNTPGQYIARTTNEHTLNVQEICEAAVHRGGTDMPAGAMQHATELFLIEMAHQLCSGNAIDTGYFIASPKIVGVFNSPAEAFKNGKHNLMFQFSPGEGLQAEIPTIEIDILGLAAPAGTIYGEAV
jgi:hypothetical protein